MHRDDGRRLPHPEARHRLPPDAGTPGTCHPAPWGVTCVDVPKTPCDPAGFPRCLDAAHGQNCSGTVDAGLFVSTYDCGATRTCTGDAGAGACR